MDPAWSDEAADRLAPALTSAAVIGTMPNVPANRISRALDLGGPGFTVSGEELSGLRALEVACEALRGGEIDAAIAGAVDFSSEPVHEAACAALGVAGAGAGADATAVWILKRREDAERDGDRVWAVLPGEALEEGARVVEAGGKTPFGRPHAALALVDATVRLLRGRGEGRMALRYEGMMGQAGMIVLRAPDPPRELPEVPAAAGEMIAVPAHMGDVRFGALVVREGKRVEAGEGGPPVMAAAPVVARVVEDRVTEVPAVAAVVARVVEDRVAEMPAMAAVVAVEAREEVV